VPGDGDGEKDMVSMLEQDEEAEEEEKKKKILIEEEEEEAKDEPSREIIKDNDVSLHGKSSALHCAHFEFSLVLFGR
jgi:hypothetical protein